VVGLLDGSKTLILKTPDVDLGETREGRVSTLLETELVTRTVSLRISA
jgi:hypothetical protein